MTLGIDYGLAKIGVAITEGEIASPLITLPNNKFFISNVKERIHENPEVIVVGIPKFRPYQELFDSFIEQLKSSFHCQIVFIEEDFSTKEAKIRLGQSMFSKKRKAKDDAMAACVILERYLEEHAQLNPVDYL